MLINGNDTKWAHSDSEQAKEDLEVIQSLDI